jgi:hypothetical protein
MEPEFSIGLDHLTSKKRSSSMSKGMDANKKRKLYGTKSRKTMYF